MLLRNESKCVDNLTGNVEIDLFLFYFLGEASVPFFHACGSDFEEIYVGMGAARVRKLFGEH